MTGRARRHALAASSAAVGYAALAVLLTWPLVVRLSDVLPHDLGDPLLSTSALWWNAHVTPLTAKWWDGFAFFPAKGTIAFSDHRLGESLLASPLQWAGASAVTAYNLTLLATFPLCALAAYWLAFTLTQRHDASLLCGLAYGFSPYRMAHLQHLELLAAFGMPAALASLHLFARMRRRRWLIVFTASLAVQALWGSYYALFFCVLLALWIVWFLPWDDRRAAVEIAAASLCALATVAPIGFGYWRIHAQYGFARTYLEIQTYSADLTSIVTASPLVALWGWTSTLNTPEKQLFPGLTVLVLAVAGLFMRKRASKASHGRPRASAIGFAIVAIAFAVIAVSPLWFGPWSASAGSNGASVRDVKKPLTVAIVALVATIVCHPSMRAAFRRRSPYAFYVIATIILFICCLGPTPTFLGAQFFYRAPYGWLMHLPLFAESVRAPARFAMLAVLTLSVAAALAYVRLTTSAPRRWLLAPLLAAALVADSWIHGLALPTVPVGYPPQLAAEVNGVLTLPFGDTVHEAVAMFRAQQSGYKSVNGLSGYEPLHSTVLQLALAGGDGTVVDALAEHGPLLVAIEKREDRNRHWTAFLSRQAGVTLLDEDDEWTWLRLARHEPTPRTAIGSAVPIVAIADDRGNVNLAALTDNDPSTGHFRTDTQFAGETLRVDLGHPVRVSSIDVSLGRNGETYPRSLSIATSPDGQKWEPAFSGSASGRAFSAALENPRDVRLRFALGSALARFIRLRLEQADRRSPWFVTDVVVNGVSARKPE